MGQVLDEGSLLAVCFLSFAFGDNQFLVTLLSLILHMFQVADVVSDGLLHTDEAVL